MLIILFLIRLNSLIFPQALNIEQAIEQGAVKGLVNQKGFTPKEYVKVGEHWYVNPEGTFYLFEYDSADSSFIRRDKSIHHGVTYGRYLFEYENSIHSFGGAGMFTEHSNLLVFNFNNAEWDQISINGFNSYYEVAYATLNGDSLLFIYHDRENYALGCIDMRSMTFKIVEKYTNEISKFFIPLEIVRGESIDYLQSNTWENGVFFDKKTQSFTEAEFSVFKKSEDSLGFQSIVGDSILMSFSSHPKMQLQYPIPSSLALDKGNFGIIAVGMILVLLFGFGFAVLIALKNSSSSFAKSTANTVISNEDLNKLVSSEQMDSILGINHSNFDTQRTERSRRIREINQQGIYSIERQRAGEDKRIVLYFIKRLRKT